MILHIQLPSISVLPSIIFLLATFDLSLADQWNPRSFVAACENGVPSTWLCDPEHLLGQDIRVTEQLAFVNNNTQDKGEIFYSDFVYYYGYVIAAAVVESVVEGSTEEISSSVTQFGNAVQKSWFGGKVCDNSTLVLASLNTSSVLLFPGDGIERRLRTSHRRVCDDIRINRTNVTEGVITCISALDEMLQDALKPYSNAPWGYAGMVVIMTMLIFHYWIKY